MRRLPRSSLAILLLAFALAIGGAFAGCGLSTGGIPSEDGGAPCTSGAQCDDKNPCTTDSCNVDGVCANTPLADGPAPAADQPTGTCQQIVCTSGEPNSVADDGNPPTAPNACVVASCSMGVPKLDSMANDKEPCTAGNVGGLCESGVCMVTCQTNADCVAKTPNPCQTASCNGGTGMCVFTDIADGLPTPGVTPTVGTCHTHVCLGGQDTNEVDDTNVPVIPAAEVGCTDAVCTDGVPTTPFHKVESVCSTFMGNQPGFCDGMGHCEECVSDNDCPGVTDDCQHPTCSNNLCTTTFAPAGTPTVSTPQQVTGSCHQYVCLGDEMNGVDYQTVVDDTNAPSSNSKCTTDVCVNGVPQTNINPNVTTIICGMVSGQPEYCNAQGQCGCQTNNDCTTPDTCGGGGTTGICGCTPKTCAELGKTCGSPFPDGCGNMLDCNQGKKAGSETDVDCGGNATACATRCAQAQKCLVDGDCSSGFCADGVCCNVACAGSTCEACTAAAKGQGVDGVCGAVVLGSDPHHDCSTQAVSTCGESGGCNGSGACSTYAPGTVCKPASCSGTTLTEPEVCTSGACTPPATAQVSCSPFLCSTTTLTCDTSCTTDAQCQTGDYCTGGTCQARSSTGTCTSNDACASMVCGISGTGNCCTAACSPTGGTCGATGCNASGACVFPGNTTTCATSCAGGELTTSTCSGSGTCTPGAPAPCAGNFACASATSCRTSCSNDTQCATGYYCSAGACIQRVAAGACSTNDACTSMVCGVSGTGDCCAAACSPIGGACGATGCNATTGACVFPSNGTTCGTSCSNGELTTSTCNGSGTCSPGLPTPCAGGLVCANATTCKTTCAVDADCVGTTNYCSSGQCVPKSATGSCSANDQCTSGVCGVAGAGDCCASTCSPIGGACGATGCNAATGACVLPSSGTPCGTSCSNGELTTSTCNGLGTCLPGVPVACAGNYLCEDASSCKTTCSLDADCANGYYCATGGTCAAQGGGGAACAGDDECTSGLCGVTGTGNCCTLACTPTAGACGATGCGVGGVCEFPGVSAPCPASCANAMLTPAGTCNGLGTCNPGGAATACTGNFACASAVACATSCPSNDAIGDASCATGFWCNSSMACVSPQATGSACTRNSQCTTSCNLMTMMCN